MTPAAPRAPAGPPEYPFALDDFQRRAIAGIDAGQSVLVAAPTGSGKTVAAEHAVATALAAGQKAFYTTPIKALSNQKFGDLVRRHGAANVGLLTGDNVINGEAPVVVMTTEVLRNMIYAGSPTLRGLRWVVLDEVHYLQDAYRGPVWEEVIIHAAPEVRLVCLSATVSNAEELAEWITTVRGPTTVVIEERRPVELQHLFLVGDRAAERLHLLPTFVDGRPNPEAIRLDEAGRGPRLRGQRRSRLYTPRRWEVIEHLDEQGMLPAIYFIFSRAACSDAVRQCQEAGLRLTSRDERDRIRALVEPHLRGLSDADLDALGYGSWISGLEAGFAAHHAGMVPPFKEAVETCFAAGLVKAVFATETLALGINMPARAVVIEKLTKFGGERHDLLTPGEYTQLTGRAGRRGIDEVGHAVVLWSPFVTFEQVAGLASTRTYHLRSAFRPTYNMAANLVRRYRAADAHHLLNLSFAQYQADAEIVRLETRAERSAAALERARAEATCELGDVADYAALQTELRAAQRTRPAPADAVNTALARLRPGQVVVVEGGKSAGPAAVIGVGQRRGGAVRLRVVNARRRVANLTAGDFDRPPRPVGAIDLPEPYQPSSHAWQREVAAAVRALRVDGETSDPVPGDEQVAGLEARLAAHPVSRCPDLSRHLRALRQIERLEREREAAVHAVRRHSESLARQFDRVLQILEGRGYLDGWALTAAGERLARIYHECDLLVAEALGAGLFDGLDPADLAGLVSCFTYEARGPGDGPAPWFPSHQVRERWSAVVELHSGLVAEEGALSLPPTRDLDPGFVALAHGWASGGDLDEVLGEEEITGGDFVRNVKQLIDLLRQLAGVAPNRATADAAGAAADRLFRGVIAVSSAVGGAG